MTELLPFIPERASTLADEFEALFWYISIVTGGVGLGVYAAMLYFCVKYRRGAATGPNGLAGSTPRILGSARLELTWTVVPLLVFLTFFAWGVRVYDKASHPPDDSMEVFIIGKQWMWKAQYPGGQRVIIGGNPRYLGVEEGSAYSEAGRKYGALVIPVNRPVRFTMTSEDVIHSFGIPAFRTKTDVLPGRYTTQWHHPTREGVYHIFCDQYCGTWHSLMVGRVEVVSEEKFNDFLLGIAPAGGTGNAVDGSLAHQGRQLFLKLNCIKCHTAKADAQAPVLEGLWGQRVPLKGGGAEVVDEAYIIESIRKPKAKVVQGWEPIMPEYDLTQVSPEDLNALVAYIRSLHRGKTPDRTDRFTPPVGAPTERTPSAGPGGKK